MSFNNKLFIFLSGWMAAVAIFPPYGWQTVLFVTMAVFYMVVGLRKGPAQ